MTIVFMLFGAALVLELLIELVEGVKASWLRHQTRPHYPWSFCTTAGSFLTSDRGYLKLSVYPMSLYRHLPSQRAGCFRINSLGFRGAELQPEASSRARVILLGGSTAFGTGLDADGQTIAAHLDSHLEHSEVINAAVIGYQSGQELAYYVKDLIDLRPNTVVVLDGWNDFSQILHTSGKRGQVLPPSLMGFNWFRNMERALADYSAIRYGSVLRRLALCLSLLFPRLCAVGSRLARTAISMTLSKEERSLEAFRRWIAGFEHSGPQADYFNLVVDAYTNNITRLRDVVCSRSARFLCVMQHPRSDDAAAGLYRAFTVAAMNRLVERGVQVMNLGDEPGRPGDECFLDSLHLNDQGCREVSALIAERLGHLTGVDVVESSAGIGA